MNQLIKKLLPLVALLFFSFSASAQITTSSINGQILSDSGEKLVGATVIAVHVPSGTNYYAVANIDGRYAIQGMRPGGPYEIRVHLLGYQTSLFQDIVLQLGVTFTQDAVLTISTEELEGVVVIASPSSKFSNEKTGAATNISSSQISRMPTINRSISDIARISPYANGMSFAGGDGRSTNFTVDGANFNNNFGLSPNLPGGGNPISMDAIDEIQVVIAPFDVRQTNFIGGGINAITKSGTNTFKGTAYTYYRNQDMRGNKINGKELDERAKESNTVYGFTFGGPIIKNKLFFFTNFEMEKTPGQVINYRANKGGETAEGNVSRTLASDMQKVQDFMMQKYGYDTGSYTDFPGDQSNMKLLARIDWNISDNHRLNLRYNYTKNTAWNAPNGNSSDTGYRLNGTYRVGNQSMAFANNMYSMDNKVQSISADLNSRFTDNLSNQLLVTFSKIDDVRGSKSAPFPHIDIMAGKDGSGKQIMEPYMSLGYELFTWNNGVHNNILTIKDDITWLKGKHKVLAGVSYEYQFADNAYMRNGTMYYRYNSLDDFLNSRTPESFAITYGWNGEPNPNARVTFNQIGFYVQDEWSISNKFKLTYGVRFDELLFDNSDIATNKAIYDLTFRDGEKIDTGLWPKANLQISPRVGFIWDVKGDKSLKVRGGTGLFAGRLPLVFFTNMPTNAGLVQNSVQFRTSYKNGVPTGYDKRLDVFNGGMMTNVQDAIKALGLQAELNESNHVAGSKISGVDPNFKMPQIWKSSIALDWQLPVSFPLTLTGEFMFNKVVSGVTIDNINIDNTMNWKRFRGADNRLIYPSNYALNKGKNAVVLTNTNKGYGYTANITLNAQPVRNLDIMVAYTMTESKEVSGLPGSDPVSTWQGLITIDGPNFGTVQRSQYVVPHRLIASVNYFLPFKIFGGKGLHLNLFYSGSSGSGYSYVYSNDMNGDGINRDLMYIPKNDSEINFKTDADRAAFWKFVEQDKYLNTHKGEYAEAYAARSPWVHRFDLRIAEDFAFNIGNTRHNFQLVFDFMNIGNLLNSKWGVYQTNAISNNSAILKYEGQNAKKQPVFSMYQKDGNYLTQSYDYNYHYGQCWKFQIGIRYLFN
ncbi:MAG TPA: carboxypeptidase regulatory-like domain-containing protein [Bacteroidales bacterium]|nr:carboxypeptidase regulatory-like domain-containing protein [Bacteroidales bacterium]